MKKAILCMMLLAVWCGPVYGFDGGDGSADDPWQVATNEHLDNVRDDLTAHYIQIDHIDLKDDYPNWEPIAGGGSGDIFTGSYDGDGYKIENLTIDRAGTDNVGLFGHIGEGAVIKNVRLAGVNVAGARGTGSLIGRVTGDTDTLIERSSAVRNTDTGGTVVGDGATGGLVDSHNSATETPGGTDNPVISQCFADIDVSLSSNTEAGKDKFGGLAGCSQKGTIMDSYARGSVTVLDANADRIGGLVGCILFRGEIIRSYSTGLVESTGTNVGGLVGNLTVQGAGNNGVVTDSYWDIETSDMTTSAGGTGKTTAEMKNQSTFTNWDFNTIWTIDSTQTNNDGYPYLLWDDPEAPDSPDIPKSRRAIVLDGVIDRVHVPHDDDDPLDVNGKSTLSVEAWVKKDSEQSDEVAVVFKDRAYGLYLENGNEPAFTVYENDTTQQTASSEFALTPGRWYHLAGTFDGTNIRIYINGYLYNTYTYGAAVTINDDEEPEPIGIGADLDPAETNTGKFFHGTIDEVRIWGEERNETNLRDSMCQKLEGTETNLSGYWRFDEVTGQTYEDNSGNENPATIYSGAHICSEAPVGDDSGHDYTGTNPEDFSVTLAQTDSFEATGDGGDWSTDNNPGLQAYWVEHAPDADGRSPMDGRLFRERGHFGVFITGGEEPTYKMSYEYDPDGIPETEPLKVAFRNNNCAPWKDVVATLGDGVLTKENLAGTEFILGTDMEPRNAIDFDETDGYIAVADDNTLDLIGAGSLEAWINITTIQDAGIISKGNTTDGYALGINASGNVVFSLYNAGASTTVTSDTILSTDPWYHIAGTWDGTDMNVYINGILDPNSTGSTQTAGSSSGTDLAIGTDTANYFNGIIDEVRVWDTARTQTQIRDTMCRKIISTDTGFSNLMGYWRFDRETTSAICPDYSANSNDGTMASFDDVAAARVCSEAPIGDGSSWDYYDGGPGPVSTQLAHPDGDYMFATEDDDTAWSDDFSGLHVYRVDEAPVYPPDIASGAYDYATGGSVGLTPPDGWSSIDYYRYWGVYVTDRDNSPAYEVEYHYCADDTETSCNPSVPDDESVLALAKRDHYCDQTWVDTGATPDTTDNFLPKSGETDTEYVLGGTNQPLAISLISFTADSDADRECIDIAWETATEVETIGFYLWRSTSRDGEYEKIEDSFTSAKSVNSTQGAKYAYQDCNVYLGDDMNYFYKLEEVDMDNTKKNPFYGPIGPVSEHGSADQVTSAKNRSNSSDSSSTCFISTLK